MARLLGFWVTRDERYEGPARLMNIAKTSGSFVTGKLKSKVWHVQVTELAIIWDRRITNRDQRGFPADATSKNMYRRTPTHGE